ncbi:MAG: sensor histidine kinase [Actinomycetota bacterium]
MGGCTGVNYDHFLPTLSEILDLEGDQADPCSRLDGLAAETVAYRNSSSRSAFQLKAQREWYGAIAALNQILSRGKGGTATVKTEFPDSLGNGVTPTATPDTEEGIVLSGPTPVLTDPVLASHFATWIFTSTPDPAESWLFRQARHPLPLLPAPADASVTSPAATPELPLLSGDPLANEQFCLVLTANFSLMMVLGEKANGIPAFQFSFEPEVVKQAWTVLRQRAGEGLLGSSDQEGEVTFHQLAHHLTKLDALFEQFPPIAPDYKTVMQFTTKLLQNLPVPKGEGRRVKEDKLSPTGMSAKFQAGTEELLPSSACASATPAGFCLYPAKEVELLQAIAHEVRTPLATIRTLTRLLLKRPNLDPVVVKRLEMIDSECTAQIDRFSLIFRAVELEESQAKQESNERDLSGQLAAISLAQVFQSNLPRWQKQAAQRNHTLEVILPQKLPTVVSDPTMLDQVLTGLIENFTRTLPTGSHIQVGVMLAGNQLKLQLESQLQPGTTDRPTFSATPTTPLKSIGPLLMFQPETGSLTLNLSVTKNLFRAAGGKLVVRQRPEKGEVMTIFLPLQ